MEKEATFACTTKNYTSIETLVEKVSIELSTFGKNSQSLSLKCKSTTRTTVGSRFAKKWLGNFAQWPPQFAGFQRFSGGGQRNSTGARDTGELSIRGKTIKGSGARAKSNIYGQFGGPGTTFIPSRIDAT
ncbi:hypothetical protein LJR231_006109 [Phyllobacterium sp. LjRoot231]|uniref:hypothetical protein n=1 Tax=Phyllobacterium sp. LjRoot231 TaxID=3342289 RepID=UPI003ED0FF96